MPSFVIHQNIRHGNQTYSQIVNVDGSRGSYTETVIVAEGSPEAKAKELLQNDNNSLTFSDRVVLDPEKTKLKEIPIIGLIIDVDRPTRVKFHTGTEVDLDASFAFVWYEKSGLQSPFAEEKTGIITAECLSEFTSTVRISAIAGE